MSEKKIYSPEHGVVILKDEDYVEVHRLEFQRFIRNIETINQLGEEWTKTTLELKAMKAERLAWFLVARQLRDALIGGKDKDEALDEYLRTRGRLEDPRE